MLAPTSAEAPTAPAGVARMRGLLISWAMLAAIWVAGMLVVELLLLQRLVLTASAMWTATLVPACQAVALESLAAPFGVGAALARMARSLRAPLTLCLGILTAASLVAGWSGGGAPLLTATAGLFGLAAAALIAAATRPKAALAAERRVALGLAALLLLAASTQFSPWLERLPQLVAPGWPPQATRLLFLLPWLGASYSALFRLQRAIAGTLPAAADWLGAAAGSGALALVIRLLPLRLDVTPNSTAPLVPATLLVLATACLALAGAGLWRTGAAR